MYVEDIISKLNKKIVRFGNTDYYPAITVQDILRKKAKESISWSVDDFETMAINNCNGDDAWEQYYNKDMFESALEEMINHHDASMGITWNTIDHYLETYCRIKDYVAPLETKFKKKKGVITTKDLIDIDSAHDEKR